jgi:nucleoside phosphorylase
VGATGLPTWEGGLDDLAVTVIQAGVGPLRAARAARDLDSSYDLLVSCGFAGALRPALAVGALVIPERIVWAQGAYEVEPALRACLRAALARLPGAPSVAGALLSSPSILATAAAKAAAGREHAAVAVEMEAAALAERARAVDRPLVPLRVILDPVDLSLEGLPPGLDTSWTARGRLLWTPTLWATALTLGRHAQVAETALRRVVAPALRAFRDVRAGAGEGE